MLLPIVLGIPVSAGVIFAVFAVTVGHGGSMTQFQPDWPGRPLPEDRTVRAADVTSARFSLAFRGYRMAEVDDALDRLAAEIAERDDAIERLTGQPFERPQPEPVAEPALTAPVAESAPTDPGPPTDQGPPTEPIAPIDELDSGH